jgi:RNA polymerase-binding transcription factor DksA
VPFFRLQITSSILAKDFGGAVSNTISHVETYEDLPRRLDMKEVRQVLKAKQTEYKAYSATLTSPHALFKLNLLLPRVNRALEKLDEGTYHLCDACEDEIPVERLRLVPAAVYCVACQEAYDVRYASG